MLTARTVACRPLACWSYRHNFQLSFKRESALYDCDERRQKQSSLAWRLLSDVTTGGSRHWAKHWVSRLGCPQAKMTGMANLRVWFQYLHTGYDLV